MSQPTRIENVLIVEDRGEDLRFSQSVVEAAFGKDVELVSVRTKQPQPGRIGEQLAEKGTLSDPWLPLDQYGPRRTPRAACQPPANGVQLPRSTDEMAPTLLLQVHHPPFFPTRNEASTTQRRRRRTYNITRHAKRATSSDSADGDADDSASAATTVPPSE